MADTKRTATKTVPKAAAKKAANAAPESFSADEKAAMKERALEVKRSKKGADGEADLLAKVAEMPEPDRGFAERIHAIVKAAAPDLQAKTWYGMPAWARDDKIVAFFQPASKFKARYGTLGFNDSATLDEGNMWATSFAISELTAAEEKRISELVKKAAS